MTMRRYLDIIAGRAPRRLREAAEAVVVRPEGWQAANDVPATWTRPGHFYRGMTDAEFRATIGAGRGVRSNQDFSTRNEGTSFAADAADAESYVNFGRDDPRVAGRPTYLVEITAGDIPQDRDGYYKAADEVPRDRITRVWKFTARGGAVVAEPILR